MTNAPLNATAATLVTTERVGGEKGGFETVGEFGRDNSLVGLVRLHRIRLRWDGLSGQVGGISGGDLHAIGGAELHAGEGGRLHAIGGTELHAGEGDSLYAIGDVE